MSNETPSERSDWRERLDQPGEAWTGREAAWETLYDRLHQKENISRRKRYPIYWAAAAAALLVISLGIVHERQHGVEGTSPAGRATDAPAVARNGQSAGNEQPVESGQPARNEQSAGSEQPIGNEQPGNNEQPVANAHPIEQSTSGNGMSRHEVYADGQHPQAPAKPTETPAAKDPAPVVPAPAESTPIVAQSTPPAPTQSTHPRPVAARLPVVSINELGTDEPVQPGGGSKSSNDHYLQIKLINEQTYTETASENGRRSSNRLGVNIHR